MHFLANHYKVNLKLYNLIQNFKTYLIVFYIFIYFSRPCFVYQWKFIEFRDFLEAESMYSDSKKRLKRLKTTNHFLNFFVIVTFNSVFSVMRRVDN